ncbi:genetic suppressor element 1-like [Lethenteron reissneri]|uniref:genetic suppressor element 1-like n=1 Tax=Lethenteron reissneri TaxID=7753 RepID=UPI002AB79012|nr:genetic suppressor element 1-like [Lethenteron reissneri]
MLHTMLPPPPAGVGRPDDSARGFRPYHAGGSGGGGGGGGGGPEEMRLPGMPPAPHGAPQHPAAGAPHALSLDPATVAAFYHPAFLAHPAFQYPAFRLDDPYCLSALRSPFFPLPPLPPLPGVRCYQPEMAAPAGIGSSTPSADRLQAEKESRQREMERERERERGARGA